MGRRSMLEQFFLIKWRWLVRTKWLTLTHTLPVALAHSPLCGKFDRRMFKLGRFRICRACSYFYTAFALAAGANFWWIWQLSAWLELTLACYLAIAANPMFRRRMALWAQHTHVIAVGAWFGYILMRCLLGGDILSWSLLAGSYGLAKLYRGTRQSDIRAVCSQCPEYGRPSACSGFRDRQLMRARLDTAISLQLRQHLNKESGSNADQRVSGM